jgi:hypothetical protein
MFVAILFFTVRACQPHPQPPSWRTILLYLPVAAYSRYSQLSSIVGGYPSIFNLRMHCALETRDPLNIGNSMSNQKIKITNSSEHATFWTELKDSELHGN